MGINNIHYAGEHGSHCWQHNWPSATLNLVGGQRKTMGLNVNTRKLNSWLLLVF